MKTGLSDFEERISRLSDSELFEMLYEKSGDYTPEALEAARKEQAKRGGLENLKHQVNREKTTEWIEKNQPLLRAESMIQKRIGGGNESEGQPCDGCGTKVADGYHCEWVGANKTSHPDWKNPALNVASFSEFTSIVISICPECARKEDKKDWRISAILVFPLICKGIKRRFHLESREEKSSYLT